MNCSQRTPRLALLLLPSIPQCAAPAADDRNARAGGHDAASVEAPARSGSSLIVVPVDLNDRLWAPSSAPFAGSADRSKTRGDLGELYADVAPSVFVVAAASCGSMATGTGFLLDAQEGLVLTNHHVVEDCYHFSKRGLHTVQLLHGALSSDGNMELADTPVVAEVVHSEPDVDLALLQIQGSHEWLGGLQPLTLSEASPRAGQECAMIGHPDSGLLWSLREGKVANTGSFELGLGEALSMLVYEIVNADPETAAEVIRQVKAQEPKNLVLSNCGGNHGDSGGPLLGVDGSVIGVTVAMPSEDQVSLLARDPDGGVVERTVSIQRSALNTGFTYHIHPEEVLAFLERAAGARQAPRSPDVPNAREVGPFVRFDRASEDSSQLDLVLGGLGQIEAVMLDLDGDTVYTGGQPNDAELASLLESRAFDAEVALYQLPDRRQAFYDTDNDGSFDCVLDDADCDGLAESGFFLRDDSWTFRPDLARPLHDLGRLGTPQAEKKMRRAVEQLGGPL